MRFVFITIEKIITNLIFLFIENLQQDESKMIHNKVWLSPLTVIFITMEDIFRKSESKSRKKL